MYREQGRRNVDLYFDHSLPFKLFDDRSKDLIELAAFVYNTQIKCSLIVSDGDEKSKVLHFHIPVRDYCFWKQDTVNNLLAQLLHSLTGDEYRFVFHKLNEPQKHKSGGKKLSGKENL